VFCDELKEAITGEHVEITQEAKLKYSWKDCGGCFGHPV
jgi:hypothetical protein